MATSASPFHPRTHVLTYLEQSLSHPGHSWSGNIWAGGQVPEHEDQRDCRRQGCQEQAGIL